MLEPLLMLTFFNCFFMFSTTVTTCALWLQHKRNYWCMSTAKSRPMRKEKIKNSLKNEILRGKTSLQRFRAKLVEKKRDVSRSREKKIMMEAGTRPAKSETKSIGIMAHPDQTDTLQQLETTCCGNLASMKNLTRKTGKTSRDSDSKPTVLMEFSTIQKVVHMVDKERDPWQCLVPSDCMSYRVSPDANRRIEFIAPNKSDES